MSRVLLTGGSGFIGSQLAARLGASGHEVLAPDRGELDLLAGDLEHRLGELGHFDVVVHAAASRERGDPSLARLPAEIALNVEATARLFEWVRTGGARAVVHLSTLSVVRPLEDAAALCDEGSPLVEAPTHPYALTKRWSEELVASLAGSIEAAAVVRPGMVYGRGQSPGSGMGRLLASVASGEPRVLVGGTGHRYAPVHVDDVTDVLFRLIEAPQTTTVIVGGPEPRFERDLVSDLARVLGVTPVLEDAPGPALSVAPSARLADALFPGRTVTGWEEGIARAFGA